MFVESGIVDNGKGSFLVDEDKNGFKMITVFRETAEGDLVWKSTQLGGLQAKDLATLMCGEPIGSFNTLG